MSVTASEQTFIGIANENEFYSHHYLADVFQGDIKAQLEAWTSREQADASQRAPFKQLSSAARTWFSEQEKARSLKDSKDQLTRPERWRPRALVCDMLRMTCCQTLLGNFTLLSSGVASESNKRLSNGASENASCMLPATARICRLWPVPSASRRNRRRKLASKNVPF